MRVPVLSVSVLSVCALAVACGGDPSSTGDTTGGAGGATAGSGGVAGSAGGAGGAGAAGGGGTAASPGCGKAPLHAAGGVQVTIDAGPEGDGQRGFWLSRPASYDPSVPHKLVVGYPGTDWVGQQIQPYLDLEASAKDDEIFVYPDPLWRDFPGWGTYGGWVLGPHADPANGDQDLVFTSALLDYMEDEYCIDPTRVFVTGHSWGGDMAEVVACFLGDRFRAAVPVAANRPYWFETAPGTFTSCKGATAVWTMFGVADDHFTWQDYPGQFGDEQRDFWLGERGCTGEDAWTDLGIGAAGECRSYEGCSSPVRHCLYGPDTGHQRPGYYPAATMDFFRSF